MTDVNKTKLKELADLALSPWRSGQCAAGTDWRRSRAVQDT